MPYYFSNDEAGKQPYIYYNNQRTTEPFDITMLLPDVFLQPQQDPITQGPFTLAANTTPPVLPYKITIPKTSSAWDFNEEAIRSGLKQDYIQFLVTLEKKGLAPGGMEFIRHSIAQFLPQTFAETLYYHYGLDGAQGYVDLHPGQRLRFDYEEFQLAKPMATGQDQYVNGYVGSGTVYCDLVGDRDAEGYPVTVFNAFLGMIRQHTVVPPNKGGAGGIVDLINADYACRYYRLLYPTTMVSSDDCGFIGNQKNVTLIGTKTLENMETASDYYINNNGQCAPAADVCTYFRGRVAIVPEILIYLRGKPVYITLGTTVRQLINSHTHIPLHQVQLPNFNYQRWLLNVDVHSVDNLEVPFPNYQPVNFSGQNYASYGNGTDCFDLPLIKGDAFTFPIPDIVS